MSITDNKSALKSVRQRNFLARDDWQRYVSSMKYYVYVDWTCEVNPRPFYVGIGDIERVRLLNKRNARHDAICKAHGQRREVVFESDDRNLIISEEIKLIEELHTRGDLDGHWGANFTRGGEGVIGRSHTEETKRKISKASSCRKTTQKARMNMRIAQSKKPIVQFDITGNQIAEYPSQLEAERVTGIPSSAIGMCCRRKIKSSGGFVWRFVGDHFDPKVRYVCSDEHRQHLRESHVGKIASLETRKKISTFLRTRRASETTKSKISASSKGRKHSDETKKKMSESRKKFLAMKKELAINVDHQ